MSKMSQMQGLLWKVKKLAFRLEELTLLPIQADTLGLYPICPMRSFLTFLLNLFPYAQWKLKFRDGLTKEDLQHVGMRAFSPISVIPRPKGEIIPKVRLGLPLPRRIQVEATEFQVQGKLNDVMENENKGEVRVIEYRITDDEEVPPLLWERAKLQARIKTWILSQYQDGVKAPSVAIINENKRRIPVQELVPYSNEETRNKLHSILHDFLRSENLEKVEEVCEECRIKDICSKLTSF
ncbi:MAG: hypothetical protein GWN31_11680 [Candidatus Thorarchaeota archaeon]|nr:hypothetical protein [Candidatus Thorarchaeota archaeon]NIW14564.1 hypothetical protein [Candidatus Thorarchaeota archaeon]NIW52636.1 hypothetical protein [Candidatus Korarchaeota archaeon]